MGWGLVKQEVTVIQGPYRSWQSVEFKLVIFQAWKSLENDRRPGKVLNNCDADLENSDVNYADDYLVSQRQSSLSENNEMLLLLSFCKEYYCNNGLLHTVRLPLIFVV